MQRRFQLILIFMLCAGLMACQPQSQLTITVTPAVTAEAEATTSSMATPEITASVSEERGLVIWVPDQMYPSDNAQITAAFDEQIQSFAAEQNVTIELRRKASQDVGGILSTLRSAASVAPGALPDLTLLRYEDFLAAEQANLLFPLDGLITASVIAELDETALRLATVEDQLYGVPYVLDVLMAAHTDDELSDTSISFDEVIENRLRYMAPINRSGISEVFWLQYLAAGGTPVENGTATLNEQALLDVLTFYEDLVESGLIDQTILDYTAISAYLPSLLDGGTDIGIVTSTQFHQLARQSATVYPATLPTHNGTVISQVNGWIWVLTASDAQQQGLAGQMINWLMDVERQGEYAQSLGVIASRSDTLRLYPPEALSLQFMDSLLANVQPPIAGQPTGNTLRAMQTALVSVIRGEVSAREAVQRAVDQLSG